MFNSNQMYIHQAQSVHLCGNAGVNLSGLSKLSLFKTKEANNSVNADQQAFVRLLSFICEPAYFIKKETQNLLCWEVYANETALRKWLIEQIEASSFDFLCWPKEHLESPKLLVFDMDSTFIQIEVIDELARQHGVGESVSQVTEAAMRGELDFSESLISRVACLQGLEESTIDNIADNLPLSPGVARLVEQSQTKNIKIVIVSGGFTPFVQRLKESMGLFEVKANNLEIEQGELTGKVSGLIVNAQVKAEFVNELRERLNINKNDILTIGDGANDLQMMKESGFSLAYRAKPAVQAQAKGRMNQTHLDDLLCVFDI